VNSTNLHRITNKSSNLAPFSSYRAVAVTRCQPMMMMMVTLSLKLCWYNDDYITLHYIT